ncbi:MAG: hypothetical protein A2W90_04975 [Bacteroidetes bacterium GWF2_42_66]|nr:MAG: hypothetical protein A2W89_21195 [Bacteroidetes bacterium GWE2_42_39]OFY40838.1 MAG: hypothetical protein A2W90_04975 [Bacteroidetes bacterium GWF2_42_66]HBL75859.1 hypothetical protein [Prolixibacteraceae bacterium]HCU63108.1 hypothetical protein [Prolixibacteraceae bacterium]
MKQLHKTIFLVASIIVIVFLFFYFFDKSIESFSKPIFGIGDGKNPNGEFLLAIFESLGALTLLVGVICGYRQIIHLSENNIHQKYKTAIEQYNSKEEGMSFCAISSLHEIAKVSKSEEHKKITKYLFLKYLKNESEINWETPDKYLCAINLFGNGNIYKADKYKNINFTKINFKDIDVSEVLNNPIEGIEFDKCNFELDNFSHNVFTRITFKNLKFIGIIFIDSRFEGCYFENVEFENSDEQNYSLLNMAVFNNCIFKNVTFHNSSMKNVTWYNNRLEEVEFLYGPLVDSSFEGSRLEKCKFVDTDLTGATYLRSRIINCNLQTTINAQPDNLNLASSLYQSKFKTKVKIGLKKTLLNNPPSFDDNFNI